MLVRLLLRLFLPTIVKTIFSSLQQQQMKQQQQPRKPEGSIFVTGEPKKKGSHDDDGEYVDYEEIR
jgi:hypothetical protein